MRKCKGTWIENYIAYTSEQESPLAFHSWTAVAVLSSAIGRSVWMDRTYYKIFPNVFIILVAGSGMCKKSTATGIGVGILKSIKNPPLVFSQKITTEALIAALQENSFNNQCVGLVYAPELSVFMGADAVKSGMIPTLTDLYDAHDKWAYHTRGRGKELIENAAISMLAASTVEWLKSSIPADSIGGGFTARIVFVNENSPSKPNLFPKRHLKFKEMREDLIHDLDEIRAMSGEVVMHVEAEKLALEWYNEHFFIPREKKVSGYYARKHDTMFKIAMILMLAEGNSLILKKEHIQNALDLLGRVELHLEEIADAVTSTEAGNTAERILDIIRRKGRIEHSDLLKRSWRFANAQEIQSILQTLTESKQIKEGLQSDNRTRYYEPT